jgi:multidrug efflux pump
MSRFFIDRPIFACVISIIVMVMGVLAILKLPVEQYPDIAPVTINVSANYRGASAQTVENSVTQLLEQQITGIDNILYFSSTSAASGQSRISISFAQGTNPDTAQVQVQNSVNRALTRLPDSVQQQGVVVTKSQGNDTLMVVGIYDTSRQMNNFDLSDYLINHIQEPIARTNGVGETNVFGSAYAMRIWLNPQKLNQYGLMPSDVRSAVIAQNTQVTAGELGAAPSSSEQYFNAQVTALSQLQTVEEFNKIIIRATPDGGLVYLKDVARLELGAENYQNVTRINGYPSSAMSISLASGANALEVSEAVRTKVAELQKSLPSGLEVAYPRDSTPFVKASIHGVVKTLLEAIVLVVIVMFVFLQSWRATLVPTIAVPVVLLGTFAVLSVLGLSINTLTLFALVLAIGLLVDDAIVVVENIERVMHEQHLSVKHATIASMQEIQGAVIGITMVRLFLSPWLSLAVRQG